MRNIERSALLMLSGWVLARASNTVAYIGELHVVGVSSCERKGRL